MLFRKKLFATFCVLVFIISSCGEAETHTIANDTAAGEKASSDISDTAENTETEDARAMAKDGLPEDIDLGGATIRVLSRSGDADTRREFLAEESSGDVVADAVYQRNLRVMERLNCSIEVSEVGNDRHSGEDINNKIKKAVNAASDEWDITANHMGQSSTLIVGGYYKDLRQTTGIAWDMPWWNATYNSAVTIDNHTCAAAGELASTMISGTYGIFFNKKIAEDHIPDTDIYSVVLDGKWTLDRINEISDLIYTDINGNSEKDTDDLFGLIYASKSIQGDALWAGSKILYTSFDNDAGTYRWALENERTSAFADKIMKLIHNSIGTYMFSEGNDYNVNLPNKFKSDGALFTIYYLSFTDLMRDMENDFGIIPIPKLNEEQDSYATTVHNGFSVFGIPITCSSPDNASAFLESACCESYRLVTPAYYETALKVKYSRDNESSQMLDILIDGISFDFAYLFNSQIGSAGTFLRDYIGSEKSLQDVMSKIAANTDKVNASIDKVVEAYSQIGF